jgi:hypothetical protein
VADRRDPGGDGLPQRGLGDRAVAVPAAVGRELEVRAGPEPDPRERPRLAEAAVRDAAERVDGDEAGQRPERREQLGRDLDVGQDLDAALLAEVVERVGRAHGAASRVGCVGGVDGACGGTDGFPPASGSGATGGDRRAAGRDEGGVDAPPHPRARGAGQQPDRGQGERQQGDGEREGERADGARHGGRQHRGEEAVDGRDRRDVGGRREGGDGGGQAEGAPGRCHP